MLSFRLFVFTDSIKRTFSVSQWFFDPMQLLPSQIAICFTAFSLALSGFLLFLHLLFLLSFVFQAFLMWVFTLFSFHVLLFSKVLSESKWILVSQYIGLILMERVSFWLFTLSTLDYPFHPSWYTASVFLFSFQELSGQPTFL